ncbi:hypothetical protein Megvenef_01648 [Candidatus Megaera venefica]|uniref:Uncharacterized protein n=1 Tax=Candidatus Megaera venefica TaxID=2055910 RepID=A0ABU5NET2_9RICK|nr:hypothetical protein [Candidatus Megaera venefica]MEA0971664.1 hypothetical protein [Candidatus Megaera venefica]
MMTKQMTYNDLENIKNSNLSLLQEAMRQAELRIQDENSRKERIDKRVYILLSISLSIIGLIFGLIKSNFLSDGYLALYGIEGCLMISLVFLFSSLKLQEYSPLGTMPKTWLLKEFVQDYNDHERNNTVHGHVLSCIVLNVQDSLSTSAASNEHRIALLNKAILMLKLSIVPICISSIYSALNTIVSWYI